MISIPVNKIRVLHLIWSGRSGGAERFIFDVVTHMDREKFESTVCFLSKGGWIADKIAEAGIKVYYLGMKNGFSLASGIRLLKIIKETKPCIIQSHTRNYLCNFLIFLFPHARKIYFEHGGDLLGDKPLRDRVFYGVFANFYDLILANSDYVRDRSAAIFRSKRNIKRVKTFYIGIDLEKYGGGSVQKESLRREFDIPQRSRVVGVVSRLVKAKGLDDFIKVAAEIDKIAPKETYAYVIIGDGYLRECLESMAKRFNVSIRFLGDREDVPSLLSIFDIFLFTSKWEPFGITLLEAMASRIPIAGFALPGAGEIVEKGGGLLLEERDCKKLAERVVAILNDREFYGKLAEEARSNVVKNFDIRKNIKKLEEEYLGLL